jgi:hypothetical protein
MKPALCLAGFHGVSQFGDNLIDVAALWALKGRCSPWLRRERNTLSHRWMPLQGGDAATMRRRKTGAMFNFAHFHKEI